jgi:phosphatidylserine/phosphatidylglycerophosphate/cardiolipin synthase-like enzyme
MKKTILVGSLCAALLTSGGAVVAAVNNTSHPSVVQWAFTRAGQHPEKLLESTYGQAHKTLDIAIYSLTKYDIVDAIVAAKKRGVKVRIITDKTEAKNKSEAKELAYLKKFGIPIKENKHSGLMHLKMSIIDGAVVTTGSFNYSQSASTVNDEVLVTMRDSTMAKAWEAEFNQMWNDSRDYTYLP